MSQFVGDSEDFQGPGQPRQLVVTADLLHQLCVVDRPRPDQERAVRQWLSKNQPPKVLAASLRSDGFLPATGRIAAG